MNSRDREQYKYINLAFWFLTWFLVALVGIGVLGVFVEGLQPRPAYYLTWTVSILLYILVGVSKFFLFNNGR